MNQLATVLSRGAFGIQAPPVLVEVHISRGLPGMSMVGMPETAVKESKDRVRAAIMNSGFEFPQHRITINLSPADIPKQGGRYDLPIAIGILAASDQVKIDRLKETELVGELALDGSLRAISGVLPVASAAAYDQHALLVPDDNGPETALVKSCDGVTAQNLIEVCAWLNQTCSLPKAYQPQIHRHQDHQDLSDIKGQEHAKRALIIAAAGGHNLLLYGPPGTGKTMLASRMPGILPPLTETQALATAQLASISAGGFNPTLWGIAPFRAPHHTASAAALVGGGSNPLPGEISLAHNGVLFLDELPEFSRHVLEVLREPMESGKIIISRAARTAEFPAQFQFISSLNPCPCGFFGDPKRQCQCSLGQIQHYRNKISGPLLDRIDLQVEVPRIPHKKLRQMANTKNVNREIQEKVIICRQLQQQRNHGKTNAQLQGKSIDKIIPLTEKQLDFLESAVDQLHLSARAYHRILKVSRTIADLENANEIKQKHLMEALSYRAFDRHTNIK